MNLTKKSLALSITLMFCGGTQAADGTITFNGTVTNSACTAIASVTADTVATGTPISATLTLPPVTVSTLNAATGTYAGQTPFSIQLTGCESQGALGNVRTLFTTTNLAAGNTMANTAVTTPAANVAIAIMQQNGVTPIDLNGGPATDPGAALPVSPLNQNMTLQYMAAYKSLSSGTGPSAVQPGNVTGVADFVISYF